MVDSKTQVAAPDDVFDPKLWVTKADGKFTEISNQISGLNFRFGDDKKFADRFREVADRDIKIQEALESIFLKSLENSNEIKNKIQGIIKTTTWLTVLSFLTPLGVGVWTLVVIFATAWAGQFFSK